MTMYCVTCGHMGVLPFSSASSCNCGARQWRGTLTPAMLPDLPMQVKNFEALQPIPVKKFIDASMLTKPCPNFEDALFYSGAPVHIGIECTYRCGLVAAVCATAKPSGEVFLKAFSFIPSEEVEKLGYAHQAPYEHWIRQGHVTVLPGYSIDYESLALALYGLTSGMGVRSISFDRWRIDMFMRAAAKVGWCQNADIRWENTGQGFKDMSPRFDELERLMRDGGLSYLENPVLNFSMLGSTIQEDSVGNRKLFGGKGVEAPLSAVLMAVHACVKGYGHSS